MLIREPRRRRGGAYAASGHVLIPRLLAYTASDAIPRLNKSLRARNGRAKTDPGSPGIGILMREVLSGAY